MRSRCGALWGAALCVLRARCLIGGSRSWMDCIDKALKAACTDAMVLLRSANGKERTNEA